MSNAVTSLTAATVPSDLITNIKNSNNNNTNATTTTTTTTSTANTNLNSNTSDTPSQTNTNYSIDTNTNLNLNVNDLSKNNINNINNSNSSTSTVVSIQSCAKVESGSASQTQMANLNINALNGASSSPVTNSASNMLQQQQQQQQQVHQVQMAGIQYFQYPSANSTTPVNVSPLSSLTSSPSTTNTPTTTTTTTSTTSSASLHYHAHSHPHQHQHQQTHTHFYQAHPHTHHPHHHPHPHHHHHHPAAATIAFSPTLIQQQQQFHTFNPNFKDTRWLTLEVCREYQRNKCNRTETECKFAHPPQHVEIVNGKVIACYDSLKGKCTRKEPPCKYLHPPQHLKDQLLQNGKNNLVLRQVALAMMQQQQQQQQQQHAQPTNAVTAGTTNAAATAAALLAVNAAGVISNQANTQLAPYATFTTNSTGATSTHTVNTGAPNVNTSTQNIPLIPASALTNAGLTAYSQVQLNANGQPTLLPMITTTSTATHNSFHHPHHHHHHHASQTQNLHIQQQGAFLAADPTALLHQVTSASTAGLSPGAAAATANGLLAPQQRTDRLLDIYYSGHSAYNNRQNFFINICKEFQNSNCQKTANECAYAHPPSHCPVDSENSLVTVCVDFIKGKCARETCKYFHPPEHLVNQLKKQKISNNATVAAINAALNANTLGLMSATVLPANSNFAQYLNLNQAPIQINSTGPYHSHSTNIHHHHQPHQTNLTHYRTYHHHTNLTRHYGNSHNSTNINALSAAFNAVTSASNNNNNNNNINNNLQASNTTFHVLPTQINLQNGSNIGLHLNLKAHHQTIDHTNGLATSNLLNTRNHTNNNANHNQSYNNSNNNNNNSPFIGNNIQTASNSALISAALATSSTGANLQSNELQNDSQNTATFTLENGQTYQIPQFQIYTPIYQRAPNATLINKANNSSEELAASASATANAAVNANVVDVVPGKKRPHDVIEQDFIPLQSANTASTATTTATTTPNAVSATTQQQIAPVKRTALTDSKTGMPVFHHSYNSHHALAAAQAAAAAAAYHHIHPQAQHLTLAQHPVSAVTAATLNYPTAINIPMQYAPYISLPYTGHPTGMPRL